MLVACLLLTLAPQVAPHPTLERLLDALEQVESGGEPDRGRDAAGDGGRSLGPLQIQRAYWLDAGVEGRYEDCREPEYARRVVIAYWRRWCPKALEQLDARTLARVHNGGPRGDRKDSTLAYWRRVRQELRATAEVSRAPGARGVESRTRKSAPAQARERRPSARVR